MLSFELLWEYAAKCYFGNISDTKSGQPLYCLESGTGHAVYQGAGEAIPDILYAARAPSGRKGLAIFDAKYYTPVWDSAHGKVSKAPPNSDIAKQIGYYHSLRQLYADPDLQFSNAFLLPQPLEGALYRRVGYAVCSPRQNQEIAALLRAPAPAAGAQDKVLLYQVDPVGLWQACLQGRTIPQEEIFSEFIAAFS